MAPDVKNEARVHLWYEARFGAAIPPYQSAEAAIATAIIFLPPKVPQTEMEHWSNPTGGTGENPILDG